MDNRIDLDDPNYSENRVVVQDNKAKMLWKILGALFVIVILIAAFCIGGNSGGSGSSQKDPRACSFLGTADVYPASHSSICISDRDGYWNPLDYHHHHK